MKKKIAITGSSGFLGSYLIEALRKEGMEISLFDENKDSLFEVETMKEFLHEADVVVHLAGANRDTDYNLFKVNTLGTAGLMEAVLKFSPNAKIIFSSSFQVYGESAYGLSKKLAENIIESFSRIYGIKGVIFRISNIYGLGGKPFYNSVIATFSHLIKNNKPIVIDGTGDQKRDYIYVEDVVSAIKKAIDYDSSSSFETFDICFGELYSINDIVNMFKKILPSKLAVEYKKRDSKEPEEINRSFEKARDSFSWKPVTSIEAGLLKVLGYEKN